MRAPQSDLVRVVVRPGQTGDDGASHPGATAWLDLDRTCQGRGAYLHPALSCLELAERDLAGTEPAGATKAGRDGDEHAMSAQQ
jgi:predicted RNA-binding protein YlxR (DUF448 family)